MQCLPMKLFCVSCRHSTTKNYKYRLISTTQKSRDLGKTSRVQDIKGLKKFGYLYSDHIIGPNFMIAEVYIQNIEGFSYMVFTVLSVN